VLADLCLESEAATLAAMRLARAYDAGVSEDELLVKRLGTAVMKYWVCKRGPRHAFEAMECLGGNGYTEAFPLARRYRQQPLQSIWEGSGNVSALDVLRVVARAPAAVDAFFAEVESAGGEGGLAPMVARLRRELADAGEIELRARRIVEGMALALQASLILRFSPPEVADAFCASRLRGEGGHEYGTLPAATAFGAIVARHAPSIAA
jgi:putative acyl-CoA dehydrogenase